MDALRPHLRIAAALGVLALVALAASHLALTDIAHGEPDLHLEWIVLRVSGVVLLGFTVFTLLTLRRAARLPRGARP